MPGPASGPVASSGPGRGWPLLWLAVAGAALFSRPALPPDETRYLAVAWDMWTRGDFLVPHLASAPYAEKPPLLFWLFHAGWALFGVNEWWPRLVGPLFALAGAWLSGRLARELWPDRPACARRAPWLLLGCLWWALFCSVTMFDTLLACCVLAGLLALLRARRAAGAAPWFLLAAATGAGLLAKGPVLWLHLLPAAAAAAWWTGPDATGARGWAWILRLAAAQAAGVALALAWALPAARAGGPDFAQAIFSGETARYLTGQAARHGEAWWWYLVRLPLLIFPWVLWPALWRALRRLRLDPGVRFCLAWALPALLALSAVPAKQEHYLLPGLPAFALLAARALEGELPRVPGRRGRLGPATALAVLGGVLLLPALGLAPERLPAWAAALGSAPGLVLLTGTAGLLAARPRSADGLIPLLALPSGLLLVVAHVLLSPHVLPEVDIRPVARAVAEQQLAGRPVAAVAKYRGELDFYGRLEQPPQAIEPPAVLVWARRHPDGVLLEEGHRRLGTGEDIAPLQTFPTGHRLFTAAAVRAAHERTR